MSAARGIKVWDPLVRIFHWALVAAFTIAYLFEDEEVLDIHVAAGYTVLGLVTFRILWGFVGPRYARFSDFVYSPRLAVQYLFDTIKLQARRYIGHNPAGGWMVVILIIAMILISASGLALYGLEEQAGPLSGFMAGAGEDVEEVLEEVHEVLSNMTVVLILIHIAGVVVESLVHRENLVRAMFTGCKREEGDA